MNKKIVQMSKEEILNTEFSFKLQSVLVSDMYVPTGFIDIGLKGYYKTFYKEVENEHKLQQVSTLQVDLGSFNTLKEKYCNSSYSNFYGKSEIFTEENFINEIQKHLPILVIDSEVIKYHILIDKDFKFTKFISKAVAEYNINKDTLDIFYGTISEAELYIKVLKG